MKFKIFSRIFLPLFFIIGIIGQVKAQWGAPIYGLSSAPDSAYMIATQFYKGIKGQPYYLPIDVFMNRYGGNSFAEANTFYIDPNGNNETALKGRIDLPFMDLQGTKGVGFNKQKQINVNQGNYTDPGPWPETTVDSVIYNRSDTVHSEFLGQTKLEIIANLPNFYAFSDVVTAYGDSRPKVFSFNGPNSTIKIDRSLNFNGISLPFSFYHVDSKVDVNIGKIEGRNGRVWGAQFGASDVKFKVGTFDSDNPLAVSIGTPVDDSGENTTDAFSRKINVHFDNIIGGNFLDISGTMRVSSIGIDSASLINLSVDELELQPTVVPFSIAVNEASFNNDINIHVGNYIRNNPMQTASEGYEPGAANFGIATVLHNTSRDSSNTNITSDYWRQTKGPIIASFVEGGVQRNFYNSTIVIDFDKMEMDTGTTFIINRFGLYEGSKIIIKCDDCTNEKSSIAAVFNNTIDATSGIYFEGNFTVNSAKPVIQTQTDRTFLNGVFKNDGTVPVVESPLATTVYVSGAFDANTIILDPDVTFVRLPEYGVTGGGGLNGIITALPIGNVNINAASNQFNITDLSSLDFSTDGTGSAESSFNLSKLSAIATRLSHEDPSDVNNASELVLDFDGNTQLLSGDGQDIAIGADANLQLNADSVRIGNLPTQKIHDNWIYEVVSNSAGYLHPVRRSYGFMTCSNEVQAITVTGGGTFDVITNGTNNLFSTIIQEGDFTIQGDSIIIDRTGVVNVDVSTSIIIPAGALGRVKILINGAAQAGGAQASDSASADAKVFAFPSMLNVIAGDVLKIGYQAVIGGNITVNAASVRVKYE